MKDLTPKSLTPKSLCYSKDYITVFGGTGYLGRHIVYRLLEKDYRVRVAVRNPQPDLFNDVNNAVEQVESDVGDIRSVREAIEGSSGVVNAVALYVEKRGATFNAVHVEGAGRIAEQSTLAGARLVHISGIGTKPDSPSSYIRARAAGDQCVRSAAPNAVILSPSVLFGSNDVFLSTLSGLVRFLPMIPLFGDGSARLQPVYVKDVAKAVETIFSNFVGNDKLFELGGADVLTYRELLELVAGYMHRKRLYLPVPFAIWNIQTAMTSILSNPPLTRDQVELMRTDNIVGPDAATFSDLGIEPRTLEDLLPLCLDANN